jgi:inorganic pyrophosphatase
MDHMIETGRIVIDRPKGSAHPRYTDMIYPLDYGYLDMTTAIDGGGIDVWIGSGDSKVLQGLICSVDVSKRDAEIKLLLGCTDREVKEIMDFLNDHSMRAMIVPRKIDLG